MDLELLYLDIMRRGQNSVLSGKEYVDKTIGDYLFIRRNLKEFSSFSYRNEGSNNE